MFTLRDADNHGRFAAAHPLETHQTFSAGPCRPVPALAHTSQVDARLRQDPAIRADVELPPVTSLYKRVFKHPRLMHYNRLIVVVLLGNVVLFIHGLVVGQWWGSGAIALDDIAQAALVNFAVAILIRQRRVINLIFWLATRLSTSWPLKIRWTCGKVYHFGGLHVGGAIAGSLWFLVLVASLTQESFRRNDSTLTETLVVSYVLVGMILAMAITAVPPMRQRYHDRFELIHRFCGWAVLLLFWVQNIFFVLSQADTVSVAFSIIGSVDLWVLALITVSVATPWFGVRKVPITVDVPSSHAAVVRFDYGLTPFTGSTSMISLTPLVEWHAFANIDIPGEAGYRIVVSRAGDWTGDFITNPPSHVWVKGGPTRGMTSVEALFGRVVFVATGSGIGPTLTYLLSRSAPTRLVWSTRSPRESYGDALVDEILSADPGAIIWDTSAHGKPDMLALAYTAYKAFDAEAIICVSNKRLTWQLVHGLESRGIPAFGAIWDS